MPLISLACLLCVALRCFALLCFALLLCADVEMVSIGQESGEGSGRDEAGGREDSLGPDPLSEVSTVQRM